MLELLICYNFLMNILVKITLFSVAWVVMLYIIHCLAARRRISLRSRELIISVFAMTTIGVFGELLIDLLYTQAFGQKLWEYRFTPINDGGSSLYSIVLWASTGGYMYLMWTLLKNQGKLSVHLAALLFSFVGVLVEALVNLTFMAWFGWHLYYFYPGELWHVTSIQTLPLYLGAGYMVFTLLWSTDRFTNRAYSTIDQSRSGS